MAIPWESPKDEIHSKRARHGTHEVSSLKEADANVFWSDSYLPTLNETEKVAAAAFVAMGTAWLAHTVLGKQSILLVENAPCMLEPLREGLARQGFKVTSAERVVSLDPFMTMTHKGEIVTQKLKSFRAAVIDGSPSRGISGEWIESGAIASALRSKNVFTVGMSAVEANNKTMLANGAALVGPKPHVLFAIFDGSIKLGRTNQNPKSVELMQATLNGLGNNYYSPQNAALRDEIKKICSNVRKTSPA